MLRRKPTKCIFKLFVVFQKANRNSSFTNVKAIETNEDVKFFVFWGFFLVLVFVFVFHFLPLSEITSGQFGNTGYLLLTRSSFPHKG